MYIILYILFSTTFFSYSLTLENAGEEYGHDTHQWFSIWGTRMSPITRTKTRNLLSSEILCLDFFQRPSVELSRVKQGTGLHSDSSGQLYLGACHHR